VKHSSTVFFLVRVVHLPVGECVGAAVCESWSS